MNLEILGPELAYVCVNPWLEWQNNLHRVARKKTQTNNSVVIRVFRRKKISFILSHQQLITCQSFTEEQYSEMLKTKY